MARIHVAITAILFSTLLVGCAQKQAAVTADGRVHGVVTHVTDGDTVAVRFGSTTEKIRLIGVDTPETVHPTKPVGCYGPEASAFTKQLLPPGTKVHVVRDAEARDYYNRLLAYVYRSSDNYFVNLELVRLGYGVPLNIEPNSAHRQEFVDAAFNAQQAQRGLWGACHG